MVTHDETWKRVSDMGQHHLKTLLIFSMESGAQLIFGETHVDVAMNRPGKWVLHHDGDGDLPDTETLTTTHVILDELLYSIWSTVVTKKKHMEERKWPCLDGFFLGHGHLSR